MLSCDLCSHAAHSYPTGARIHPIEPVSVGGDHTWKNVYGQPWKTSNAKLTMV
jgi:hypothetical protein